MASKRAARRTTTRIGMATAILGALLAVTGLGTSSAAADRPNQDETTKIDVCHRTNSPGNPYQLNEVSINAAGQVVGGQDHTSHAGPPFDFAAYAAHLADPDNVPNPYAPPMNEDDWGDIVPAYGDFPGLNWTTEGQAIHAADCGAPPVDVCPDVEGVQTDEGDCPAPVDVCPDVEGVQTDEEDCPAPVDVCPDVEGVQTDEAECTEIDNGQAITICHATGSATNPYQKIGVNYHAADGSDNDHVGHADDIVPPYGDFAGQNWTAANEALWEDGCQEADVEDEVLRPSTPKAPAAPAVPAVEADVVQPASQPQVQPVQVQGRTFLPKTGADGMQLAYLGLGLVLMGAGLVVGTRVELRTT